jgi:uncharacterized membrane protein YccF (DUF307 family)
MKILGNIIWLIFGGFIIAVEYLTGSIALIITIFDIPFGLQHFKLTNMALTPFGRDIVSI